MATDLQVRDFTAHDIGSGGNTGHIDQQDGRVILTGEARSIWGSADNCIFYGQTVEGDFDLVTEIDTVAEAKTQNDSFNVWAKAGVMVREDLDEGARNAALLVLPHRVRLQRRAERREKTGIVDDPVTNVSLPLRLRIERSGNTFTAYAAKNNEQWKQVGTVSLDLPGILHAGVTATNSEEEASCQAIFSNIQVRATEASQE